MDTKERELVGEFKSVGREWERSGQPVQVNTHDFPSHATGKAIPYGVYDLGRNEGWISVGVSRDAAQLAVNRSPRGGSSSGERRTRPPAA